MAGEVRVKIPLPYYTNTHRLLYSRALHQHGVLSSGEILAREYYRSIFHFGSFDIVS